MPVFAMDVTRMMMLANTSTLGLCEYIAACLYCCFNRWFEALAVFRSSWRDSLPILPYLMVNLPNLDLAQGAGPKGFRKVSVCPQGKTLCSANA